MHKVYNPFNLILYIHLLKVVVGVQLACKVIIEDVKNGGSPNQTSKRGLLGSMKLLVSLCNQTACTNKTMYFLQVTFTFYGSVLECYSTYSGEHLHK